MLELQPRTLPHLISSEQFVRMLRILRAAAPELITIELIAAFEVRSSTAFTVAFILGSVYIIGSAANFATLSQENKNQWGRKVFTFIDDFVHANWMSLRLVSSIAITGIVLATKSVGPIIVPDWVIVPLEVPAVAVALGYAIIKAKDIENKPATILGSILLAAQMSRLLNMPTDILALAGIDVTYLYRTGTIILSTGTAVLLKLLETGRSSIQSAQKVIQYSSWMTYPVSVILDNIQLKALVWPVPTYLTQGITAAGATTAGVILAKKYYDSTTPVEEVPLIPKEKKTTIGCWSRMKTKLSNCCWASWWRPEASENNSNSMSAQTDQSAKTALNLKSPSLNSGAQMN